MPPEGKQGESSYRIVFGGSFAALGRIGTSALPSLPAGYTIPQINTTTEVSDSCASPASLTGQGRFHARQWRALRLAAVAGLATYPNNPSRPAAPVNSADALIALQRLGPDGPCAVLAAFAE